MKQLKTLQLQIFEIFPIEILLHGVFLVIGFSSNTKILYSKFNSANQLQQIKNQKKIPNILSEEDHSKAKALLGPGYYKHGTSHYNTTCIDWLDPAIKEHYRKLKTGKRMTFIDTILLEASKLPGVGKYNI